MTHQNRIPDPTEQFNEIHEEYNDNGAHHNAIGDEEEGEVTALPKTFFLDNCEPLEKKLEVEKLGEDGPQMCWCATCSRRSCS